MSRIFVYHEKDDKKTARRLVSKLESDGMSCFVPDREISGEKSEETISESFGECSVFLLILSSFSENSIKAHKLVEKAVEQGLRIIPFRISKTSYSVGMSYMLSALDWVDAFEDGFDEAYSVLLEIMNEDGSTVQIKQPKQAVSQKNDTSSGTISNKTLIIIGVAVLFVILGYFVWNSSKSNDTKDAEIEDLIENSEEQVVDSEEAVIGEWRVVDYQDSRNIDPVAQKQNLDFLKQNVKVVFKDDYTFERYGYSESVQKGKWEFSFPEKKIYLIPIGVNRKEEMNLVRLNNKFMTMIVVENITDETTQKPITVTTKISFRKGI